ncbi:Uncharacterized protein involved in cysteine biosynthesis [Limimonas halophila]|uniref:Uncharacterized protein involved in cysteine biosynthesis n=1 Tax=Limimonas halophila TaxID=1082479 RepID=A0A1G7S3L1_9PROT|nr:EI24 domain-containing protein [Limimonas halophila]SDG17586.1 Uncharacterized protein involved in cysteine biosynthesis [Limimonas halophila]
MLVGLLKAIGQLSDPRFRGLVWRALAISVVTFAGLWALAWWGIDAGGDSLAAWLGAESWWGWAVEILVALGGLAGVLVASFLIFPAVMGLTQQFYLEDAAARVEARHYPDLPPAEGQPILEGVKDGVDLALATIVVNVIALPIYLLLFPPLNVFVFYGVNGYLLGREYFEVVAVRRLHRSRVRALRRAYQGRVVAAGVVIAVLMTLPVVNLLAPVIAAAFMVHVVERIRRRAGAPAVRAA